MPGLPDRVAHPVELIDIMPTVLEMMGIPWSGEAADGGSLVGGMRGSAGADTIAFSEVCFRDVASRVKTEGKGGDDPNLRSLRAGHWKVVHDVDRARWEMYNLLRDPREAANLAGGAPARRFEHMQRLLLDWMAEQEALAAAENQTLDRIGEMDAEAEEALRSLGYVQ
jgi:arylsulfatase A-like enzyme